INMDQVLDTFIANNSNVPSLSMLVVRDGAIIYSHTAGFMDAAKTRAPSQATLYKTSSIAKLIIAVAVMQQVDLGVLDIDADVGNYLPFAVRNPAFPNHIITARMLMQHGAGLSNPDFGEATDTLFEAFDPAVIVQLHPLIENALTPGSADYRDTLWLAGEPGSVNRNSNFGMVLLAYLVEQLSGMHYIDYAKASIFMPLRMTGTSHYFPDLDPNEVVALFDMNNQETTQTSNWFYPISGLFTSTADWANFMRAILNGGSFNGSQVLQPSSVAQMLATTTPANNQLAYNSSIGLIWREAAANPGWVGHTGAGSQMTHVTEIDPVNNIGYVLFTGEGQIDGLVGPGSVLNSTIHQWLVQQLL
ncbi:MAG: beta-lactamase family protein, partial [Gammaproteobacteria bacterium]|nr:beta-lactamase family protein [Gammaproteobacteria bacterium]